MLKGLFDGILNNKAIINTALGAVRKDMQKNGITCIVIQLSSEETGDIPGLDIKQFMEPVGMLTGTDLEEYIAYMEAKNNPPVQIYFPEEGAVQAGKAQEGRDLAHDAGMSTDDYDRQIKAFANKRINDFELPFQGEKEDDNV